MPSKRSKPRRAKGEKKVFELIRWTLARACPEFDINPRTLVKRVKTAGILPGDDGKWSTLQIHRAVAGDYEFERIRKTREEADDIALSNAEKRREVADLVSLSNVTNPIMAILAQRIANLPIAQHLKDEIRGDIAKLLAVVRPGPLAESRGLAESVAGDPDAAAVADDS